MALTINGNALTSAAGVTFNGKNVRRVVHNGVAVWPPTPTTAVQWVAYHAGVKGWESYSDMAGLAAEDANVAAIAASDKALALISYDDGLSEGYQERCKALGLGPTVDETCWASDIFTKYDIRWYGDEKNYSSDEMTRRDGFTVGHEAVSTDYNNTGANRAPWWFYSTTPGSFYGWPHIAIICAVHNEHSSIQQTIYCRSYWTGEDYAGVSTKARYTLDLPTSYACFRSASARSNSYRWISLQGYMYEPIPTQEELMAF